MPTYPTTLSDTTGGQPDFSTAIARLRARCVQSQLDVLGSILADPTAGLADSENEGVTAENFTERDTLLIYLACVNTRHEPTINTLRLARAALKAEGFWTTTGGIMFGPVWCNESLAMLAETFFPSLAYMRSNALRLREDVAAL